MYIYFYFFIYIIILFSIFYLYKSKNENYTPSIGLSYIPKRDSFEYYNINRNNEEKNIAVFTILANYHFNVVNSFVKSLDDVNFKGHIILLVKYFSLTFLIQLSIKF